jgi:hypothetical protein
MGSVPVDWVHLADDMIKWYAFMNAATKTSRITEGLTASQQIFCIMNLVHACLCDFGFQALKTRPILTFFQDTTSEQVCLATL